VSFFEVLTFGHYDLKHFSRKKVSAHSGRTNKVGVLVVVKHECLRVYDGASTKSFNNKHPFHSSVVGAGSFNHSLSNQNQIFSFLVLLANQKTFLKGFAREVINHRILGDHRQGSEVGYLIHFLFNEHLNRVVVQAGTLFKLVG